MSLINEMLRDLEARGGSEPDAQVRSAPGPSAPRRRAWPLVSFAALASALVIAFMLVDQPPTNERATVAATFNEAKKEAAAIETITPPQDEVAATTPVTALPQAEPALQSESGQPVESTEEVRTPEPVAESVPTIAVVQPDEKSTTKESVIVRRHEPTPDEIAARAGRDGFAALRNGDWASAARLLQELVAFEPANDEAREGLVVALTRQGRIAEADGALIDGVALGTRPARFAKLRARLQAGRGELDAAIASLSIAVPAISADPEYHALKAALAQQAGRHDLAATTWSALTAFEPTNGTWQAGLGMALDKLGDFDGARAAYDRALAAGRLDDALLAHVQRRVTALTDQER